MSQQLDLSPELARLLCFTADVATAIRMYSAYNQSDIDQIKQFASEDILWLSDCMHNFGYLGGAVLSGDIDKINFACVTLTAAYRNYSTVREGGGLRLSHPSFERNAGRFSLQHGIEIFESIQKKLELNRDKQPALSAGPSD